jgi:hypothetical protein
VTINGGAKRITCSCVSFARSDLQPHEHVLDARRAQTAQRREQIVAELGRAHREPLVDEHADVAVLAPRADGERRNPQQFGSRLSRSP